MKQKQYNLFFIKYMRRGESSQQRQKLDKKYSTKNTVPYKSHQSHMLTYLHSWWSKTFCNYSTNK